MERGGREQGLLRNILLKTYLRNMGQPHSRVVNSVVR